MKIKARIYGNMNSMYLNLLHFAVHKMKKNTP